VGLVRNERREREEHVVRRAIDRHELQRGLRGDGEVADREGDEGGDRVQHTGVARPARVRGHLGRGEVPEAQDRVARGGRSVTGRAQPEGLGEGAGVTADRWKSKEASAGEGRGPPVADRVTVAPARAMAGELSEASNLDEGIEVTIGLFFANRCARFEAGVADGVDVADEEQGRRRKVLLDEQGVAQIPVERDLRV